MPFYKKPTSAISVIGTARHVMEAGLIHLHALPVQGASISGSIRTMVYVVVIIATRGYLRAGEGWVSMWIQHMDLTHTVDVRLVQQVVSTVLELQTLATYVKTTITSSMTALPVSQLFSVCSADLPRMVEW